MQSGPAQSGPAQSGPSDPPPPRGEGAPPPATPREGPEEPGLRLLSDELGPLSLRVEGGDAALRLVIEAQRPETADLLRRHAEALRQELRAEGLAAVAVAIGTGSGAGAGGRGAAPDRDGPEHAPGAGPGPGGPDHGPTDGPASPRNRAPARGHLDLRL